MVHSMSVSASSSVTARAPVGPSRTARGWALALLALAAAGAGIPSPLYPAYQAQLGFSDLTLTAVYAIYPLISVPAVFLLGPLGDRFSPRRVMRCGVVIAAAGSLALALATSTGWLVLGRVAYGIALAVITGAGVAVATSGAEKVRAGRVSAVVFILGTGAGPVLGGALTRYGPTPGLLPFGVDLVLLGVVFVGLGSVRDPESGPSTEAGADPGGAPAPTARRALVVAAVNGLLGWAVVGLFLGLISSVAERFPRHRRPARGRRPRRRTPGVVDADGAGGRSAGSPSCAARGPGRPGGVARGPRARRGLARRDRDGLRRRGPRQRPALRRGDHHRQHDDPTAPGQPHRRCRLLRLLPRRRTPGPARRPAHGRASP
ncbi:MFS transporter [Actinomycetospora succinea]|uniref:MFS transporter n=1 Tax=Actinomycetospora succinea TaxID=663603 RepID=A0A4R6VE64_9PSEU|nr:MFS transporter [Actinomycetospora succinea]